MGLLKQNKGLQQAQKLKSTNCYQNPGNSVPMRPSWESAGEQASENQNG